MFEYAGFRGCLLGNVRLIAGLSCPTALVYRLVSVCLNTKTAVLWQKYKERDVAFFQEAISLHDLFPFCVAE
jgi:hypothetical protein